MKKFFIVALMLLMVFSPIISNEASAKVMWGKIELKEGQIGKVTVLSNTSLWKFSENAPVKEKRVLKQGEEFAVYSSKKVNNRVFYGIGSGLFVENSKTIKYETPSKAKLNQLKAEKQLSFLRDTTKEYVYNNFVNGELVDEQIVTFTMNKNGYDIWSNSTLAGTFDTYQKESKNGIFTNNDQLALKYPTKVGQKWTLVDSYNNETVTYTITNTNMSGEILAGNFENVIEVEETRGSNKYKYYRYYAQGVGLILSKYNGEIIQELKSIRDNR